MVSTLFRDPQVRSSALSTLQPRAFGSLNRVETLDSASNYYLVVVGYIVVALAPMKSSKTLSCYRRKINFYL